MEINLQCPIKSAKYFGWQHVLKDLGDFKKCISQKFGENPDMYAWLGLQGHNGLDIPYADGTEVYASHDGTAYYSEDSSKGLGITITDSGQKIKTIYWHLKEAVKPINTAWSVKQGELIGYGDNTGFSTSSHLHFGLKLLDSNGDVLNRDNGYDGAVDLLPYIVWWEMNKFELRQMTGSSEVWLVRDGKKSHVYNAQALLMVADFADIKPITQAELDLLPDSGFELASLVRE